ncbi:MAG: hypothetical protein LBK82_06420 [Planctomycetaceae bacterium]|nr:hypothetical protein [Planctomycetaceae bacterium]
MTPTRKATPFAVVHLIHCRRVRRRDLLANSKRSPTYTYDYQFDDSGGKYLIR